MNHYQRTNQKTARSQPKLERVELRKLEAEQKRRDQAARRELEEEKRRKKEGQKVGGSAIRKKTRQPVSTEKPGMTYAGATAPAAVPEPAPAESGGGACPVCPTPSTDAAPVKQKAFPIMLMLVLFFLAAEAG